MLALHRDFGKPEIAAAVHCSEHIPAAPSAIAIAGQRGGSSRTQSIAQRKQSIA
jgi:hypothetical protein